MFPPNHGGGAMSENFGTPPPPEPPNYPIKPNASSTAWKIAGGGCLSIFLGVIGFFYASAKLFTGLVFSETQSDLEGGWKNLADLSGLAIFVGFVALIVAFVYYLLNKGEK